MPIFDRFVPKERGGQERNAFHSTPYRKMFSELDETAEEVKARYPDDSKTVDAFLRVLKESCKARRKQVLEGEWQPLKAEARFFLSADRMSAYACLLPPENNGEAITLETFLEDLHYEGITYGVLQDEIPGEFALGYLHIFPVARGKPPRPGEDGKLTELFQRRTNMHTEIRDGSEVDFGPDSQVQPIRKGTVICIIRPPKEGLDGMDVAGQTLPSPPVVSAYVPKGKNTIIDRGGRALTAGVDGILYIEDDRFCIQEQKIIDGDVEQFQGTLQISGNLYIGGNVDGGVVVEASGDIIINGKMGQARVTSTGGTIRVQQGVYGTDGQTFLMSARQVQSPVLEYAEVFAETSVIGETITNCVIRCGGTVYAMGGRGMIADSEIHAGESVLCLRIGNIAGGRSKLSVGYPPHIPESWERVRAELLEIGPILEVLWEHITKLKKLGRRISDHEQSVLEKLLEQRKLYIERQEVLKTELGIANKALDKKSKGIIRCEKLYPCLDVQIGRFKEEITTIEEDCNIHVQDGILRFKK
ncbi:MAG: DUF342 domain-containing protein [Ruminiclostridium sp.]|jgi:uncharacterized protein (DUF342 family)|nr:DUF342 domain-containing protein [Ruminiclostridium sp.]